MSIVDQVRSFNRFYTREIGLLAKHLPASNCTLAEARVLYELAQVPEQTAADMIRTLKMDKAHVSRIVSRFVNAGLVKRRVSPEHGKQKLLSLTAAGKKSFKKMNDGTVAQIGALVQPLSAESRRRLARNMRDIQRVLQPRSQSPQEVRIRPLKVGDLGWIAHRQGVLYHQEYGWDWTYEGLVSQILGSFCAQFDPHREDAWIAERNGEIVGSVFLMKTDDPAVGRLRLLYVEPSARGLGLGSRLVRLCIQRARELHYPKLVLWTNKVLLAARKIYQAEGFHLTAENRHRSFGKDLVGQTWELELENDAG